jgi:hypothetical protein
MSPWSIQGEALPKEVEYCSIGESNTSYEFSFDSWEAEEENVEARSMTRREKDNLPRMN